jgi:hypothetical protein
LVKLTLNRPQQLFLQTGSGKQACSPANVAYLVNTILEESQRSITNSLRDNPVPCTRIAEEPPTAGGTNPQTLTNSHSAYLTKHLCCCPVLPMTLALFQTTLAGNKNSQQTIGVRGKDLLLF